MAAAWHEPDSRSCHAVARHALTLAMTGVATRDAWLRGGDVDLETIPPP